MNKTELAALVNSLRAALDATMLRCVAAERDVQHAQQQEQWLRNQVRELEHRLAVPPPPSRDMAAEYARSIKLINSGSVYRPAQEDEVPDLWVSDAHVDDAPRVPFVKIH